MKKRVGARGASGRVGCKWASGVRVGVASGEKVVGAVVAASDERSKAHGDRNADDAIPNYQQELRNKLL